MKVRSLISSLKKPDCTCQGYVVKKVVYRANLACVNGVSWRVGSKMRLIQGWVSHRPTISFLSHSPEYLGCLQGWCSAVFMCIENMKNIFFFERENNNTGKDESELLRNDCELFFYTILTKGLAFLCRRTNILSSPSFPLTLSFYWPHSSDRALLLFLLASFICPFSFLKVLLLLTVGFSLSDGIPDTLRLFSWR